MRRKYFFKILLFNIIKFKVFYGRDNGRTNLFEEIELSEINVKKQTSNKNNTQDNLPNNRPPKNRSGRSINKPANYCINIAHTLLNSHNTSPLLPYKPRKNSVASTEESKLTFKFRKFIKPANRTEKRRINKFKKTVSNQNLNSSFKDDSI